MQAPHLALVPRARRARGTGSIRWHQPTQKWRAVLPKRLDPKERPVYFATYEQAEAWLDTELVRHFETAVDPPAALTLGSYSLDWLELTSASEDWSPRTTSGKLCHLAYLDALRGRALADVTRTDLQRVVAALLSDEPRTLTRADGATYTVRRAVSAAYLHGVVGTWRRMFESAVDDKLLTENPTRKLALPPARTERRESWTPAETRRLVPLILNERHGAVLALIFGAGLRISEALGLAWEDVDWERGRARIHQHADGPRILARVKGRVGKWVKLLPPVLVALRRQQERQTWPPDGSRPARYVSEWWNGRRSTRVSRDTIVADLRRIAAEAGVRQLTPHAGRHAVGNVLGAQRVPTATIADRLRHRSRRVTEDWYLESDEESEARADALLTALFTSGALTDNRDANG